MRKNKKVTSLKIYIGLKELSNIKKDVLAIIYSKFFSNYKVERKKL